MFLDNWLIRIDSDSDRYTLSKTEDNIVLVTFNSSVIVTIHNNSNRPTFVTKDAIIRVDPLKQEILICSSNDGIDRFEH